MDAFIKAQHHHLGKGGIHCPCCNNLAKTGKDNVDKKLNRLARAKIKSDTRKEIIDIF